MKSAPSAFDTPDLPDLNQESLSLAPGRGASAIIVRLRHAIETGVYADGDQLPPERQLATAFNAARSTIRKALNQLEESGLVVRRVGSGTYVNYAGPLSEPGADIADLISPLNSATSEGFLGAFGLTGGDFIFRYGTDRPFFFFLPGPYCVGLM